MLSLKNNLISFLVGSSIIGGLVSFSYIGVGFAKWRDGDLWENYHFEWMMGGVLVLLGLFNIIAQNLVNEYNWYGWNIIVGMIFGLVLSSIGRFGFDFPVKIFGFNEDNAWLVHIYAMLLYGFIVFGGIIGGISHYLKLN